MRINREELLVVLETVKPFVAKNDRVPVLQNVLFYEKGIYACSGLFGIIIDTELDLPNISVPFDKLYVFVKGAKKDIDFEIVGKDEVLELKSGKSSSKIPLDDIDDYPEFDVEIKEDSPATTLDEAFKESLKYCLPFASKKSAQIHLHGVCFNESGVWATDGTRFAYYYDSFIAQDIESQTIEVEAGVVIPSNFAKILLSFDFDLDTVYYDSQKIILNSDIGITVFGNVISAEDFPKLQQYMPKVKQEDFINFPKDELKDGLLKVGDFSGDAQEEAECVLVLGDSVSITYKGSTAQIKEAFNFGNTYPEGEYILNPYYFSYLLDSCDDFAFCKNKKLNVLYGKSSDGKFECVLALKQKSNKED